MRRIGLFLILLVIIKSSLAQPPSTTHWFTLQVPIVFNQHWQWLNETSYRTLGERVSLNQLFFRSGARYTFNQRWNMAGSVDLVFSRTSSSKDNHEFGDELRFWQEGNFQLPLKNNFFLQTRLRIEERFFFETSAKEAFRAFRFRYRLGFVKKTSEKWSTQFSNEILSQIAKKKLEFNQNRFSISEAYQMKPGVQFQFAYYWSKFSVGSQHIFAVVFQKRILVNAKRRKQDG